MLHREESRDVNVGLGVVIVRAERLGRPFGGQTARAAVTRTERIVAIVADEPGVHREETRTARLDGTALDARGLVRRNERAAQIEELIREPACTEFLREPRSRCAERYARVVRRRM